MTDPYADWTEEPAVPADGDPYADWSEETVLDPLIEPLPQPVDRDALLGELFKASLGQDGDRHAAANALAKKTGVPPDVVRAKYDDIDKAWKASQFDPKKFRADRPDLASLLESNPALAGVYLQDKQLNAIDHALNLKLDVEEWAGKNLGLDWLRDSTGGLTDFLAPGAMFDAPGLLKDKAKDLHAVATGGSLPTAQERRDADRAKPTQQLVRPDVLSDAVAKGEEDRLPMVFGARFSEAAHHMELSKLGHELMMRRSVDDTLISDLDAATNGASTKVLAAMDRASPWLSSRINANRAAANDLEGRIIAMQQKAVPRDFREGPFEQVASDAATVWASQWEVYKEAGIWAGVGATVGAVAGAWRGKSTKAAKEGAWLGVKLLGTAGMAKASYTLESGSAYLELGDALTDEGKPLTEAEKRGAAMFYGALAATVEVASETSKLRALGSLGKAMATGEKQAALAALRANLQDAGFRQLLSKAATQWVKVGATESLEEFTQSLLNQGTNYLARSVSQGQAQETSLEAVEAGVDRAATEAKMVFLPAGAQGGVMIGGQVYLQRMYEARLTDDEKRLQVITTATRDSAAVQADPAAVAQLIAQKTAAHGDPVTHLYISPHAFTRLFQTDESGVNAAAAELLGEDGAQKLAEAIATESKLEVPMEQWLSKFAQSDVAEQLLSETVTRSSDETPTERKAREQFEEEETTRLVEEDEKNGGVPVDPDEAAFVDALEEQLLATKKTSKADARASIAPLRAFARTMADRLGISVSELFRDWHGSVVTGDEKAAPVEGMTLRAAQSVIASQFLSKRLHADGDKSKALSLEDRTRELFYDPVSGLRNRRGWDESPRQEGKKVAVITTPDVKAINDDPGGGHDTSNELLRTIGAAVAAFDPEAARSGTNFLVHVADEQGLRDVVAAIQAAMPDPNIAVEGALGEDLDAAFAALDQTTDAKRAAGTLPARGQTNLDLSKLGQLKFAKDPVQADLTINLRARAYAMSDDEFFHEAYEDKLIPGVLSATGWNAIPRKKYVASIDLKGLKRVNELLGKEAGTEVLRVFGLAAKDIFGEEFDFAHLSGDEFAAQANDRAALERWLADLNAELQYVRAEHTDSTGDTVKIKAEFRHGIGEGTYGAADQDLNARKRSEAAGGNDVRRARGVGEEAPGAQGTAERRNDAGDVPRPGDVAQRPARPQRRGAAGQDFVTEEVERYLQDDDSAAHMRGYTDFAKAGLKRVFRVALNESANLSTFLHESGHVFLEFFGDISSREDAPQQVRDDYAAALKWMGVSSRSELRVEHHEKFARGFERYLFEGKSPSPALAGVFEKFKLWMKGIYRSFRDLNVELNDDIRGVFDRLFATDEEIKKTSRLMGLRPLFRSAEEAGMSGDQWQAYLKTQEDATSHATRALEHRVLKDRLRERESWWKQEQEKHLAAAEDAYESLPARIVQRFLRGATREEGGKVLKARDATPIDRAQVIAAVGEKAAKQFTTKARGGVPIDEVAGLQGYATGAKMLQDIVALPDRKKWVKQKAAQLMAAAHPDVLEETEKMRELAAKGLHGDQTVSWLLKEIAALTARVSKDGRMTPLAAIKRAAKEIVGKRLAGRIDVGGTLRAERAAADKAMKAAAKGDYAQALVFKQQQLLNMMIHRELTEAREDRESLLELASDLSKDKARARLGKANQAYLGAVDLLLETFALRPPLEREAPLPSLNELIAQLEADGATVMFDEDVLTKALASPRKWQELRVSEMRELLIALKNVKGAASTKATVQLDGKRADKAQVVAELLLEAGANMKDRGPIASSKSAETLAQRAGGMWNSFTGSILKIETVTNWLGGGDVRSVWSRAIIKPMQDAKAKEADILRKTVKPILDLFEKMPKEVQDTFMDSIDGKKLFPNHSVALEQDLSPPSKRFELIMMALNAGNESNLQRLLEGRNISLTELEAALDLLTKEELDFVQAVWDACESLWPEVRALEERDAGLAPPKIPARPLVTRHGTYRGGYFPAIYDSRVEAVGERQAADTIASLMDPSFSRGGTSHSHTKKRATSFSGALSLEPANIPRHLLQVAHDLAFREAVKSVGSLILTPEIQAELKARVGEGRSKQFLQWVKDAGQMRGMEGFAHAALMLKVMRGIRANVIVSALGYSIPNMIEDSSNVPAALARTDLRPGHLAAAMAEMSPQKVLGTIAFIREKSGEMRARQDDLQRAFGNQVRDITARKNPIAKALRTLKDNAFIFLSFSSTATSSPVWLGSYRQALAEGMSDEDAVAKADANVRAVFGSHSPIDLAPILRDKGVVGALLMFYGFLSTMANGVLDISHQFAKADDVKGRGIAAARMLGYMTAAMVLSSFLRGRGPDDEEGWVAWYVRKMVTGTMSLVPFGGDAANYVDAHILDKRTMTRNSSLVGLIGQAGEAAVMLADEDKETEAGLVKLARALGPLLGLPVTQILRSGGYIADAFQGEAEIGPFATPRGLIYGPEKTQAAK